MARRYALVIGISEYQSPLKTLSKTANDAAAVATVLNQVGNFQSVSHLTGKVPSTALIQTLRTLLLEQATQNDVLIYFTGHGIPVVDPVVGKPKAYLAASDTLVTLDNQQVTEVRRAVPLDSLNELIQQSQLSSLVMLFDSCHSGDFLERSLVEKTFTAFSTRKDYYLITACRRFEQAYAKKSEEHSIFTGALLAGLSQANVNESGQVTGDRLFEFIAMKLKDSEQEPIRMGYGALITLVSYQPEPKIVAAIVDETGEPICPYQGLQAFTAAQREFFFGRQRVIEDIRQRLERRPFVAIIGPSGSGKSSVVRAGLIPWLEETGWTVLPPIKPGFEPLAALRTVFEPFFQRSNRDMQQLRQLIQREPNSLPTLVTRLSSASSEQEPSQRFLLVVDQFEELFTLCADGGERQRFIDLITEVVNLADSRLAVVITMRADFLEPCLRYPALHQLIDESQAKYLSAPTGIDLRDAIVEPARRQSYSVEDSLLLKILEDVGKEPGFLPLLEFALTKLWEQRDRERKLLTLGQYENLGGLTGALNLHAEKVYHYRDFDQSCPTEERSEQEQQWIQRIFLRLVRTGEEEKDTRQRRSKTELLALAENDLNQQELLRELIEDEGGLVRGRLLVTGQDHLNTEPWIDLAHEALLDGWKRFAEWRQENRDLRRLIDRIENAYREWEQQQRHDDFLLPKSLLLQIEAQDENFQSNLSSVVKEFYQLSRVREQEREAAIDWARSEGSLNARAKAAIQQLQRQPIEGLALTLQTIKLNLEHLNKPLLGSVQNSLYQAMNYVHECNYYQGHTEAVNSVAFSPNGQMIVSGSADGTIRRWSLDEELMGHLFEAHRGSIWAVAFSPDGQFLASGSADKTIQVWNLNGTPVGQSFEGHEDAVRSVAFSPIPIAFSSEVGYVIASGSADKTVRLWSMNGRPIGEPFQGHEACILSVAFSPDGQMIASSSHDHTIRLWRLDGTLVGQPFRGHQGSVRCVAFSRDGQMIASGSADKTVRLWRLDGTPVGKPLQGHQASIRSVSFAPDNQVIASGSTDRTVRVWDLYGTPLSQSFRGHQDSVRSVMFSPDGQTIVSGSSDRTIRLWSLDSILTSEVFQGHQDSVQSVAFSSDGKTIVSSGYDGTIRMWNLNGASIGKTLRCHQGSINSMAFSPDGQMIVSGSIYGTIRLWGINGTSIGQTFEGHQDCVTSLAFSPNSQLFVSSSQDETIRLWRVDGSPFGQPIQSGQGPVWSVAFSPDGQMIVSGNHDGTIQLWKLDGSPVAQPFQAEQSNILSVAFSPDGQKIISGSYDGLIQLWRLDGTPIGQPFRGHESHVLSVAFSPDGQIIVSGGWDGTIRLWSPDGMAFSEPFRGHKSPINSVAFSPDGKAIVSGSNDKTIRLWRVGSWQDWLAICCNRIRHHPYFTNPETEEARAACEVCRKYVWEKEP